MKVKELIEILQKQDPDRLVVLSRDEEGNGFEPLSSMGVHPAAYHDGETGLETLTDELKAEGFTEDDVMEDGEPCLVLWP